MKKIVLILGLGLLTLLSSCSSMMVNYVGRTYPRKTNPELYFSWNDVPQAYETMGYVIGEITWTAEKTQQVIVKKGMECGADAIVFDNPIEPGRQMTITEQVNPHQNGETRTTTATERETSSIKQLRATFIKYK